MPTETLEQAVRRITLQVLRSAGCGMMTAEGSNSEFISPLHLTDTEVHAAANILHDFLLAREKDQLLETTRVVFEFNQQRRKWASFVTGARCVDDARQAFSAAVLTAQLLDPRLLPITLIIPIDDVNYEVRPCVEAGSDAADMSGNVTDFGDLN